MTTPTAPPTSGAPPPMDWREQRRQWREQRRAERYEKYEKGEKHNEKAEKGGRGGGIIGPLVGGSILIWLGITFYLQQIGYLLSSDWWAYFVAGIGVILIVQGAALYSIYRRPFIGSFIGGAILLLVGISFIANISQNFWPLILVVIGGAIVVSAFAARGRRPAPTTSP